MRSARGRANLVIRTCSQATRILVEQQRARGVEYLVKGQAGVSRRVDANREIIVCSGAINTPKLLQLSGIGNAQHLQALGVPVV